MRSMLKLASPFFAALAICLGTAAVAAAQSEPDTVEMGLQCPWENNVCPRDRQCIGWPLGLCREVDVIKPWNGEHWYFICTCR